ncbi:protein kinase domain-containing protein [Parachitinimonas caeni]|uniref:Protein kinase n=1 Tax=Parachitinimonas caeni TaxID=3031301 RepID=A0ABT7DUN9_9NEIS|nr:protein kinase [Parachitinimonas caeni]MDK2123772.1 protein kinase [Parachitinimonas caeni]
MGEMPEKIGKYRIVRELGRGTTGVVYLAVDPFLGTQVAIKRAHPELLEDRSQGGRFLRLLQNEASLVGKLKHPHIAALLDAEIEEHEAYVVVEYVEGSTLEVHCSVDELLPVRDVVEVIFKCCNALDYAQRLGLIHRDIKPANILLTREREVKLTDFGAALALKSEKTQITGFIGSPAFMSPEQVMEKPLTHQSDIYSLGVVMYQLLTGRLPFEADSDYTTIYKICNETPQPLKVLRPELPDGLQAIIDHTLARDPARRYPTWVAFAEALASLFRELPRRGDDVADSEKFNLLKPLSFFSEFSDVELWSVLRLGTWHWLPRGTQLIREGMPGNSFYILVEGRVSVTRKGWELDTLDAGESLGEMAYLNPASRVRSATITADTDISVLKIRGDSLHQAPPELQMRFDKVFIRLLVERLTQANRQLAAIDIGRI